MGQKCVMMDRDGVVNVRRYCPEDHTKHYVLKWEDFEWMPGAMEACVKVIRSGYKLLFVSNQAGIGECLASKGTIEGIFCAMVVQIWLASGLTGRIDRHIDYKFCPHTKDFGCECRKPRPGLITHQMVEWELRPKDCWMIGDAVSDMKAGWNAGIRKLIKVPSLEEPDAPEYDYRTARHNFHRNTASGLLIDGLPNAVDFLLEWDNENP